MSIEIQGLTKIFGEQRAVDEISFEVGAGKILGFLGPNGAGKSTTMKMITSYLKQDSGHIYACGYDTVKDSLKTRELIGYLPEHNPLYLDMYVKEYLDFVCGIHKLDQKQLRIKDVIEQVGLGKEQHKLIGTLSKGYRQRVGLAQAIIHDPQVLILDEPTSGLDMNQLQDIRTLIKEMGKTKTVIFSTHIMQEVQALCERVIIINNGRLVADDPIGMLSQKVAGDNILVIDVHQADTLKDKFEKIPGVKSVTVIDGQLHLTHAADTDIREAVFRFCTEQNIPMLGMKQMDYNVEDVFKKLTKE